MQSGGRCCLELRQTSAIISINYRTASLAWAFLVIWETLVGNILRTGTWPEEIADHFQDYIPRQRSPAISAAHWSCAYRAAVNEQVLSRLQLIAGSPGLLRH